MKDTGPNWGLAFGSGSFLIVWLLGFLANVAIETIALRACFATILGSLLGILVGQTLQGIKSLRDEVAKGSKLDLTVPASDEELSPPKPAATEKTAVVPEAPAAAAPGAATPEPFQPLDFKQAARAVQKQMAE